MWVYFLIFPCIAAIAFYYLQTIQIMYQLLVQKVTIAISGWLITETPEAFVIDYPYGPKWYKLMIPKHNNKRILSVKIESGEDIKHILKKYMGPYDNFGNVSGLTPRLLGYGRLIFKDVSFTEYTFIGDEEISF